MFLFLNAVSIDRLVKVRSCIVYARTYKYDDRKPFVSFYESNVYTSTQC